MQNAGRYCLQPNSDVIMNITNYRADASAVHGVYIITLLNKPSTIRLLKSVASKDSPPTSTSFITQIVPKGPI